MRILVIFLALFATKITASPDIGHFIIPQTGEAEGNFTNNILWRIGDTQKIQWTSICQNFTIALWQQDLAGGGREGPTIFGKYLKCFNLVSLKTLTIIV
jgi:hypothetical protein